jgi:NAD(P)-dependent dehydrogenase (short-subunit alcohol dehydrogenase family)
MSSYLITGSSCGIGLNLATQLSSFPSREVSVVFATARSVSPALQSLVDGSAGKVVFVKLDAADETSVKAASIAVKETLSVRGMVGLDVLVNNAGMMCWTPEGIAAMKDLSEHLITNVVSAHLITSAFLPLLKAGNTKKILNVYVQRKCV